MSFINKIHSLHDRQGTLYRPCKSDAHRGTFWPRMDTSNCTDLRPDPFSITVFIEDIQN